MTRLKSIFCASLLTLAVSSSALGGNIQSRSGNIQSQTTSLVETSRSGNIQSRSIDVDIIVNTLLNAVALLT